MKKINKMSLSFLSAIYIFPVALTFIKSFEFKGNVGIGQYIELFIYNYPYFRYFGNSVIVAIVSSVGCIIISLPLGFLFSKIKFRFRNAIFTTFIVVMMMPFQALMLPDYILLRDLGLLNTPAAIMLPLLFSPLAVFLLRQYMKEIPDEQLDAFMLESFSPLKALFYILLPQARPAIVTLFILLFCECWNIYEQVFVFSPQNEEIFPLSAMFSQIPKDVHFSSAITYMFPVIILFILFENVLYSGMEKYRL